ncbi:rab-GTPase-TBC domain-containing protein [Flagelloscypha sp. PMI_526]|nr:rab-GTPase-TBC domain-containing protein [Flagelloscypha sp. PMI_526]
MSSPATTASSGPEPTPAASLAALMSPGNDEFDKGSSTGGGSARSSLADSDFDNVDDGRFSTVTLSKEESISLNTNTTPATILEDAEEELKNLVTPMNETPTNPIPHKKSPSASLTIRESVPSEPVANGLMSPTRAHADSVSPDAQQKLQQEFSRLHTEDQDENPGAPTINWDFWGEVISDYQKFASGNGDVLAEEITRGIPQSLRGMMWQLMAASKDHELEETYSRLLKETSPHEKAITRDLGRTFPHHDYFTEGQGVGQENLFNVLKAYSLYDPEVGYCQGMHFVVAILLLNMPDEEAFSLLVRLMHVYDLRGHFLPEMPKLQQRLFDRLIEDLLPVLHIHLLRQGIKSSMFCSQWFLTMFSYRFPLSVVFRIYDNCLASGIEAMFGFSVALLYQNEDQLLSMKFDEILAFLTNNILDLYLVSNAAQMESGANKLTPVYDVDRFVQDAVNLRITPFMLDGYAHEYQDMVRKSNKHEIEMDELKNANRALVNQVKTLEISLAAINSEHVELMNDMVKLRVRQEETEDELVRYKLLYAEAMHQQEDRNSQHRLSSMSHLSHTHSRGSSQSGSSLSILSSFRRSPTS